MTTSYRQYTTIQLVQDLAGSSINITNDLISQAEELIDAYCASYTYPSSKAPFYEGEAFLTVTFSGTTGQLSNTYGKNYLQYTNLVVLEGTNKGKIVAVIESNNNQITINDSLSGSLECRISQLGKFPRTIDVSVIDNTYYKTIPFSVQRATTYLAYELYKDENLLDKATLATSYSLGRDGSYSETRTREGVQVLSTLSSQLEQILPTKVKHFLAEYKIQGLM